MDERIYKWIQEFIPESEIAGVCEFLNRGFSLDAEASLASVFHYAKEHNKTVAEVLTQLEAEWKRNWTFQHPDIRARIEAPGAAGIQNVTSMGNIYHNLDIPSPLKGKLLA